MNRILLLLVVAALACGSDDSSSPGTGGLTSYSLAESWTCPSNTNCQDVFDVHFEAGSAVTLQATDVTGGSILNIALYAPGAALGSINMLTNTTNEYRCGAIANCDGLPDGQRVANFLIPDTGTYRFAVTRDWGESCGGNGTYRLAISANKKFPKPTLTANDTLSQAPGAECP